MSCSKMVVTQVQGYMIRYDKTKPQALIVCASQSAPLFSSMGIDYGVNHIKGSLIHKILPVPWNIHAL